MRWQERRVLETGSDRPIKMISSRLRFVFVMSMCIKVGWRVIIEAILIENSKLSDVKSL